MKANAHLKIIDEKTIKEIVQKLDELEKLIDPYVTPLTPHERRPYSPSLQFSVIFAIIE